LALFASASSALFGCGSSSSGSGSVDPVAAGATAGCETASTALLATEPTMLPGRACLNCHSASGSASDSDVRWTVAGTVYSSAGALCNSGGVAGATVEILKSDGSVQATLTTNSAGNFYTLAPIQFPMRARVTLGTKKVEMAGLQTSGNCATCHAQPASGGAPGRIYIN
jgi:hypothetical protein